MAPIQNNRPVAPRPPVSTAAPVAVPAGGESKPGKMKTWVDSKNPALPKDGYLQFDFKTVGDRKVPTRITLEGGKKASVKEVKIDGETGYLIQAGKETLLAMPLRNSGGSFRFFAPTTAHDRSTNVALMNQQWKPVAGSDVGKLFERAMGIANSDAAPVTSPADLATAKKARDLAASAGVAKSVDTLAQSSAAARAGVAEASAKMAAALKDLGPALKEGVIVNRPNANGEVTFEIADNPNMKPGERAKLVEKFGDRLSNLTQSARVVERGLNRAKAMREGNASELMKQVNSGPFLASLEKLKPAERMAKINEIAAQVAGTAAGAELAKDLFEFRPGEVKASMGRLTPSTELGKLLFKDVYKDPAAVTQLKGLAVNLAGQLPGDRYDATARLFEISLGEKLTPAQQHASFELTNAKPEQLDTGKGFDKFGDVTDLLSALGDGAKEAKLAKGETAFQAGAAILGTYQMLRGISDMAKDPSLGGAVGVVEDASRSAGAWAGWLSKEGSTFSKVGKKLGLASDVIGLVKDLHAMGTASSPEKKYDGFVNSYASALIIAGTLAADVTPWGIAAQVVGLGVKLFREETSDTYDNAHKTLKQATKTPAEKAAEAAAAQADYDRRSKVTHYGKNI